MPRELLRIPCSQAEIVLLKYPDERYQIDIYWSEAGYYETLLEATNNLDCTYRILGTVLILC